MADRGHSGGIDTDTITARVAEIQAHAAQITPDWPCHRSDPQGHYHRQDIDELADTITALLEHVAALTAERDALVAERKVTATGCTPGRWYSSAESQQFDLGETITIIAEQENASHVDVARVLNFDDFPCAEEHEAEEIDALAQANARLIAQAPTLLAERDAHAARVTALEGERERHEPPCASQNLSATCVYLRDGTKVVVRRDGKKAWLEVVPQATVRATAPKDGAS